MPDSQADMASYFVRNSVFRLLNGPTASSVSVSVQAGAASAAIDASTATSNTTTHTASTSTAEPEVHAAPAPAAPVAEVAVAPPAPAPVHVHIPEVIAVEVPHVAVQEIAHVDTPLTVAVPEPSVPSAPKSYSDMARAGAVAQAAASPARLSMRPTSARPATALKTQDFSAGSGSSKPPATAAGPSLSLYVKQVPENASEQDVLTLFGRFGPVKRVELNGQRGFAFVDYESASSVQACLLSTKESALELLGSALKVEERNSRGGGGPGGNSSGGRSKSGVRREGDNRDRREGGRGEGGRGAGREGGDRERRDRDRRGPKPDGTNGNGAASGGSKPSAEGSGVRAAKK